ncbi:DUF6161 domain-containing protein [Brevundimonas sp.]|uniref:DUF6161 domain-containing protein n=1 Tax=Brevundimonas sp. TaxID=1871086 RepID=UPI00356A7333
MATENDVLEFITYDRSEWRLVGWRRVEAWLSELAEFWSWAATSNVADPANIRGNMLHRITAVTAEAKRLKGDGHGPASLLPQINQNFQDAYTPTHPDTERGRILKLVRSSAGDEATVFAYSVLNQLVPPSTASTVGQFRGATLAITPEIFALADKTSEIESERRKLRKALIDLRAEEDERQLDRERAWNTALEALGSSGREWATRHTQAWLRYVRHSHRRGNGLVAKIKQTDAAFTELMKLKGPVQYWRDKANGHMIGEAIAGVSVLIFFPTAIWLIGTTFWRLGQYLLTTPTETLPPGLYFIASAGLATLAGLVLWVGRLLTKLFLSQHHLRQDANERATMTTTYLALMTEGAASDVDRTIILNALFRNTSDGIIKEEGGMDPGLSAVLARVLAKP